MNAGLYCIINKVNDKMYLGSSTNLKKRLLEHRRILRNGCHINPHLQAAFDKYGEENFEFRIIAYTDNDEAILLEDHLLKNNPDMFEYNIAKNATAPMRGREFSEEHRRKISEAHKGNINMLGKHLSDETKRKISEAHIGKTLSEEHKRKLSESQMGENNHNFGKHFSEEHKRKLSEANSGENNYLFGKHLPEETRRKISESQKLYWASQKESE